VGTGSRLAFELTIGITLADLTRLTHVTDAGHAVGADRWRQLSEDLERLHGMAIAKPRT
jgi:hypothetical protein